jgi:hypothetical protein
MNYCKSIMVGKHLAVRSHPRPGGDKTRRNEESTQLTGGPPKRSDAQRQVGLPLCVGMTQIIHRAKAHSILVLSGANVNCDWVLNPLDVVLLAGMVYKSLPPPPCP